AVKQWIFFFLPASRPASIVLWSIGKRTDTGVSNIQYIIRISTADIHSPSFVKRQSREEQKGDKTILSCIPDCLLSSELLLASCQCYMNKVASSRRPSTSRLLSKDEEEEEEEEEEKKSGEGRLSILATKLCFCHTKLRKTDTCKRIKLGRAERGGVYVTLSTPKDVETVHWTDFSSTPGKVVPIYTRITYKGTGSRR
ncbi:hypothetical protein L249_1563, partial [Ophiocordyceps polyrhachis-furcata BCC 54312]